MVIKKFVARTLPDALTKVKKDFGEDAVILKTRFNNKGAENGAERMVEVTAAIDNAAAKERKAALADMQEKAAIRERSAVSANRANSPDVGEMKKQVRAGNVPVVPREQVVNRLKTAEDIPDNKTVSEKPDPLEKIEKMQLPSELLSDIKKEITDISRNIRHNVQQQTSSESFYKSAETFLNEIKQDISLLRRQNEETIFGLPRGNTLDFLRFLIDSHVNEEIALTAIKNIPTELFYSDDFGPCHAMLVENLSKLLYSGEPVKIAESGPTVIMLAGPTGSGKSSAAARMAFKYSMEGNCPVTLVTTDTFRADSKEQLASLANVIGCDFRTASSPDELSVMIRTIKNGLVIIDTSGISVKRDLDDLATLIGAANPQEVHLVVPADIPAGDLADLTWDNPLISVDKVLVTKTDQSRNRGGIISAGAKFGLKFSYESSSRELPGQFDLFDPAKFVSGLVRSGRSEQTASKEDR